MKTKTAVKTAVTRRSLFNRCNPWESKSEPQFNLKVGTRLLRGVVVRSQKSLPRPPFLSKFLSVIQTKKGSSVSTDLPFLKPWALSPQTQTKLSQLDRYRSPPLGSGKQGLVFQDVRLLVLSSLSTP